MFTLNQILITTVLFVILFMGEGFAHCTLSFKDSAIVNDTCITLGDIASVVSDDKSVQLNNLMARIVGESAPAGYSRRISSNEIVTYVLKKGLYDCDVKSLNKSIKVSTAFAEKKVGDYSELIYKYLNDSISWDPKDFKIEIRNESEKWKCFNKPLSVQINGLSNRYARGNIDLKLVAKQDSKTYSIPVNCYIIVNTSVVVAKQTIARGGLLTSENCSIERRNITRFGYDAFSSLSIVHDMIASRTIPKDVILYDKYLTKLPIVGKDDQVFVVVDRGCVKVSIVMRAREQGALGDRIWVENEMTHKLLKTKIIGKGTVELLQGGKTI